MIQTQSTIHNSYTYVLYAIHHAHTQYIIHSLHNLPNTQHVFRHYDVLTDINNKDISDHDLTYMQKPQIHN